MNKLKILIVVLLAGSLATAHGQNRKPYKAWVTLTDGTKTKGILVFAREDGIVLLDMKQADTLEIIEYQSIEALKVRRKGKVGRGALIGAASGIALGAILGFSEGDDPPECWIFCANADEKAMAYGILLSIPGAGVGTLIGTGRKKLVINGDRQQYLAVLPTLQGLALR